MLPAQPLRRSRFDWASLKRDGEALPAGVVERLAWYERNVNQSRLEHVILQTAIIVVTASIPVAVAAHLAAWLVAGLGATATALVGLTHLLHAQENWVRLSGTLVGIQAEIVSWSSKNSAYAGADADRQLVNQIERMVLAETGQWAELIKQQPQAPPDGAATQKSAQ